MELKIKVTTPKGQAKATEKKLRPFLLGGRKINAVWTNEDDNEIYWEIHTDIRNAMKIQRNVSMYDSTIKSIFEHKLVKKMSEKKLSLEDNAQLKDMLANQTSIEIIKASTAEELIEDNKTFWQKIKEKFKRQNPED